MEGVIVPVVLFGGLYALIAYVYHVKTRKSERLALIAAGKDAGIFNEADRKPSTDLSIKYGLLMIGVGVGLLMGELLVWISAIEPAVAYVSMSLLFGGLSLVVFYLFQRKHEKKDA
jgi:inner membrane protein involved in colicin E2 resistance